MSAEHEDVLVCVVSPSAGGFMFEACSYISTVPAFLSGELPE